MEAAINWILGGAGVAQDSRTTALHLAQNEPNPFRGNTSIGFRLAREEPVNLSILDAAGRLVRNLCNERRAAGDHGIVWDGRDQANRPAAGGTYFVRLSAGGRTETRRATLVR